MRLTAFIAMVCAFALGGKAMAEELKVGDKAPNFELQASDGKTYKLSDFAGKQAVVLAWFPAAFTQGCTIECKSLAEHGADIRKDDVTYFMASVDPIEGEKGNKAFAESQKADFPLLSDPTKKTAEAYGVLNAKRFGQPLDVLHRQGRQHRLHRQSGQAGDVGRRHGSQLGELKVAAKK